MTCPYPVQGMPVRNLNQLFRHLMLERYRLPVAEQRIQALSVLGALPGGHGCLAATCWRSAYPAVIPISHSLTTSDGVGPSDPWFL